MTGKLSVGSEFPKGVKFAYVPYSSDTSGLLACGAPIQINTDKELSNKTVVIFGVPGAFTPPCTEKHIGPLGKKVPELKKKGVDDIIVISANDPFVLSAWGKALDLADKVKFASDPNVEFAKANGLSFDGSANGLGVRVTRFAAIVKNGKIEYLGVESNPEEVTSSSVDSVLAKL